MSKSLRSRKARAKVHDYACVERLKFAVEKAIDILEK